MVLQHLKLNYITQWKYCKNCKKCELPNSSLFGWSRLWVWKFFSLLLCVWKKNPANTNIKALKRKKKVTDALATLEFPVERKVTGCQRTLLKYQENISKQYDRANCSQIVIVFWNFQEKLIEALAIVD